MANTYNYGQKGVSTDLQFGKRGPRLVANASTSALQVTTDDGATLSNLRIANATVSTDAVTKAQLDASVANVGSNAFNITLGDIDAGGDGDWFITPDQGEYDGNSSVSRSGAVALTNSTTVAESIDTLNETMWNIQNNTYVRDVSFTSNVSEGGNPLSVTLTVNATGNANRYTIDWGDGDTTTATTDSTPSHTYTDNTNSPFDVQVTAFNNSGTGSGSSASHTETDFITLYTATPVADFDLYSASSGGSALTGNNRYMIAGNVVYLENTTTNSSSATCTYEINWGDGSANTSVSSGGAGDVGQARASHTYSASSSSSMYTITMQQTAHSTASPGEVGSTTTDSFKVYATTPSTPQGLSSKTISFGESSSGTSPYLASGFTDNSSDDSGTAGQSVSRITNSSAGTFTDSSIISTYAYNAEAGDLGVNLNGTLLDNTSFSSGDDAGTYGNLVITADDDYQFLTASGSSTSFSSSTNYPGAFEGFKARARFTTADLPVGTNSMYLSHSATGNTNIVSFVKDDLTSAPTVSMTGATITENSPGTLKYVSGIPYYTNNATLDLAGVSVYNWIGQTYRNTSQPFQVTNGTNQEGTSGSAIGTQNYSYAQIDGSSTFLSGGIPIANTGKDSGNAYSIGTISVSVNGGGTGIEQLKARLYNVNGSGNYEELSGKYIQAWNSTSGIDEENIPVSDSLGAGFDDDGKRITGFGSGDTPAFDSSVNNYTANVWTGAETIAGTVEAVNRFGTIKHFDTDLSSSAYLPTGPNLNSGRSGDQYFTFAFRRTTMANFDITLSGTISGLFIAAPGTDIDDASSLNGWLDAGTTYGGSGTPGGDTSNGGNGSNGCAFTSGDRIIDGTSYNNSTFTMTLGDQNGTNATGNNILVRIKLQDGDSLTALSVA